MADPGQELSSINFSNMIGGPLRAVIEAQAEAAQSTVNFIKAVGFKEGDATDPEATSTGEPIYVSFKYPKLIAPYQPATQYSATVNVTSPGSGYTSPTVSFSGGAGSGMQGTAAVDAAGGIASVAITDLGTGLRASRPSASLAAAGAVQFSTSYSHPRRSLSPRSSSRCRSRCRS